VQETKSLPQRRPAETATGLAGAAVAILVATTGLSTELATALVVLVAGLPGVVTAIVNLRRSTAAGQMLVNLTPNVAGLATSALAAASAENVSLTDKTTTLKAVTESMASWSDVLIVEPGAEAPPER
jgi:hypothetical protein